MHSEIQNEVIKDIYSKFDFNYFDFSLILDHEIYTKIEFIENSLFNCLYESKFVVYDFYECQKQISANISQKSKLIAVFCIEKRCIIFKFIDINLIKHILNKLKASQINLCSNYKQIKELNNWQNKSANDEVTNFCKNFTELETSNEFVKLTIKPLISYLIRRFYQPSCFFKDQSFFKFNKKYKSQEEKTKKKFSDFLCSTNIKDFKMNYETLFSDLIRMNSDDKNEFLYFDEKEFIYLGVIAVKETKLINLVIHIPSFYIFAMSIPKYISEHEKKFCTKFYHRCFTRFYGFVTKEKENIKNENDSNSKGKENIKKENDSNSKGKETVNSNIEKKRNAEFDETEREITGFIYEFMCNGSLVSYISKHKNEIDPFFQLNAIIRIYQSIYFLHSNNLLHRDLNITNILVDNNKNCYVNDYETICENENRKCSTYFGSPYSSPEQNSGDIITFATDIFAFGLITCSLFEKKILIAKNYFFKENEMKNCPKNFQVLINKCIKHEAKKRCNLDCIKEVLYEETRLSHFVKEYVMKNKLNKILLYDIVQFFYENILIRYQSNKIFPDKSYLDDIFHFQYIMFSYKESNSEINNELSNYFYELPIDLFTNIKFISNAYYILGNCYYNGDVFMRNYSIARYYYDLSIILNNSNAYVMLGIMHENGYGITKDYKLAKDFYKISVRIDNNAEGLFRIGFLYYNGKGVDVDYREAEKYFDLSAKQGCGYGYFYLGILYNDGFDKDLSLSIKMFTLACEKNCPEAFTMLGIFYEQGISFKQDYSKAIEMYQTAMKLNDHNAMACIGILFYNGSGVSRDINKAKQYFELASKQNDSIAFLYLGHIYFYEKHKYQQAFHYYKLSANHNNAEALTHLGLCYRTGKGVNVDIHNAIYYFELAAKQNESMALINLASIYINGYSVEKNIVKSLEYLELAAEQKNSNALLGLGIIYEFGVGNEIKIDNKKAAKYYELSANLNNSEAIYRLGYFYYFGKGVDFDINKSIYYYTRVIERSKIDLNQYSYIAYNDLGLIYLLENKNFLDKKFIKKCFKNAAKNYLKIILHLQVIILVICMKHLEKLMNQFSII